MSARGDVIRDIDGRGVAQAGKRYMGRELAGFRLEPELAQEPFLLGLHLVHCALAGGAGENSAGLRPAETVETVDGDGERVAAARVAENGIHFLRHTVVDVTNEAQGDVIVLRIDPACPG